MVMRLPAYRYIRRWLLAVDSLPTIPVRIRFLSFSGVATVAGNASLQQSTSIIEWCTYLGHSYCSWKLSNSYDFSMLLYIQTYGRSHRWYPWRLALIMCFIDWYQIDSYIGYPGVVHLFRLPVALWLQILSMVAGWLLSALPGPQLQSYIKMNSYMLVRLAVANS